MSGPQLVATPVATAGPFRSQKRMARYLGVTPLTFRMLRREHEDFPEPYYMRKRGDGLPVWSVPEVLAWLVKQPRQLTEHHKARGGARERAGRAA